MAAGGTVTANVTNIAPGATVTCTFQNDKLGSIRIIKDADPEGAQDFAFTVDQKPAGATTLPVEDPAWYDASGGRVECGPQRITYTGLAGTDGAGAARQECTREISISAHTADDGCGQSG